mmetsp:Transcript_19126/g.30422  ORF Transcript_19126/g.30422 Transcript_19126/m.30422 type:complete len:324 (-) Transcript_19126:155-1126(-)
MLNTENIEDIFSDTEAESVCHIIDQKGTPKAVGSVGLIKSSVSGMRSPSEGRDTKHRLTFHSPRHKYQFSDGMTPTSPPRNKRGSLASQRAGSESSVSTIVPPPPPISPPGSKLRNSFDPSGSSFLDNSIAPLTSEDHEYFAASDTDNSVVVSHNEGKTSLSTPPPYRYSSSPMQTNLFPGSRLTYENKYDTSTSRSGVFISVHSKSLSRGSMRRIPRPFSPAPYPEERRSRTKETEIGVPDDVKMWDEDDVLDWARQHPMLSRRHDILRCLVDKEIDGPTLLSFGKETDVEEAGIGDSFEDHVRIVRAVSELKNGGIKSRTT